MEKDHEVFMALSQLDAIIKHATELKSKIGQDEKDIPAWIQDHISRTENYIHQANEGFYTTESVKPIPTFSEFVNEGKTLNRADLMKWLKTIFSHVETTEKFNGSQGGVWMSAENGEEMNGSRILSYYANKYGKYEEGILNKFRKQLDDKGWYPEWYDAGTLMIWPKINKLMKNLQSYEDFLLESTKTIDDIVKNKKYFSINIGSGNHGIQNPTEERIKELISDFIRHYFFDSDFVYNYADKSKEDYKKWYVQNIKEPFLKDIDKFMHQYMELKNDTWQIKKGLSNEILVKEQFLKSKNLPDQVRYEWNLYRWDYAGEKNEPKRYQYIETGSIKTIKEK